MKCSLCVCLMLFLPSVSGAVDEWPQFRGPTGDGQADASNLPDTWSESQNIAWKTAVPGRGWSSPAVAEGVAWISYAIVEPLDEADVERIRKEKLSGSPIDSQMEVMGSAKMFVVGVDLNTGKLRKPIPLAQVAAPDPIHYLNSYASPSPIVHDGKLVCHFGKYGTICLDTKTSQVLWKKEFVIDHSVGPGSSPALHNGVVIIPCDGTDNQFVIGLDLKTGKQLWRTDRPKMTGKLGDMHKAFATPLVVKHKGKDQAIVPGAQWFVSYDPMTGRELWRFHHGEGFSNVPSPIVKKGVAYLCTGFEQPELCAIRIDGSGDVTKTAELWRHRRQVPMMSSPILVEDAIYFISNQGVLTCLEAADGKPRWQKRLKGNFIASPICADGKIFFCSREGETTVLRSGDKFDQIAMNVLPDQLMASPVVVGDTLLLRGESYLYKIRKQETVERTTRKSP